MNVQSLSFLLFLAVTVCAALGIAGGWRMSLFAFLVIAVWMFENGKARFVWMPLIPGTFYSFATVTYITHAQIGFGLPWTPAYIIGGVVAVTYLTVILWYGNKRATGMRLSK